MMTDGRLFVNQGMELLRRRICWSRISAYAYDNDDESMTTMMNG